MRRGTKKLGRRPDPEYRLWLSHLGFVTVIVGMIVFGVQLQNATKGQWNVTPIVGGAISAFGNQVVTTVLVTCERPPPYIILQVQVLTYLKTPSTAIPTAAPR